jgi:hypothetical protein
MSEETTKTKTKGKPRGRAAAKVKLKHNPKTSREDLLKKYKEVTDWGIYGIDDFTMEIVKHLWENPEITFHATDINQDRLAYANRDFSNRSFSAYRWHIYSHQGFIEHPVVDVIVVSKQLWETAKALPNPYNVDLVLLEEI